MVADLVVDALAVYRIVRFIQRDSLLDEQREYVINRWGSHRWTELIECPWCLSPYVAAGVIIARRVNPRLWGIIARGLAFSAGAGVITGLVDQLDD